MSLTSYIRVLKRWWFVILGAVLAAIAVALIVTVLSPTKYEGLAIVRVATPASLVSGTVGFDDVTFLDRLQNTYISLTRSDEFLEEVQRTLALDSKPDVSIEARPNTELLEVRARASSADQAAAVTNAVALALIGEVRTISDATAASIDAQFDLRVTGLEAQVSAARSALASLDAIDPSLLAERAELADRIAATQDVLRTERIEHARDRAANDARVSSVSVVRPATPPADPSSPRLALNLGLGALAGLLGGLGLAFLFENRYRRLDGRDEIREVARADVLSEIPKLSRGELAAASDNGSRQGHAFTRLSLSVQAMEGLSDSRMLLITSAEPREGRSTVALNLASAMAAAGQSVLLVDADLRGPTLHVLLDRPNDVGLSSVLSGEESLPRALQSSGLTNLYVLTAGPALDQPATLLDSKRLESAFTEARAGFDRVIVDSPALLAVSDALTLARLVDDVLLVVGQGQVGPDAVQAARDQLASVGVAPAGVVVNRAHEASSYRHYEAAHR